MEIVEIVEVVEVLGVVGTVVGAVVAVLVEEFSTTFHNFADAFTTHFVGGFGVILEGLEEFVGFGICGLCECCKAGRIAGFVEFVGCMRYAEFVGLMGFTEFIGVVGIEGIVNFAEFVPFASCVEFKVEFAVEEF